jgi:hypothetical protein
MDYSRTKIAVAFMNTKIEDGLFTDRGYSSGEEVAYEAVVNYREPTQPNPGYNETDAVRSVRPKGKRC